MSDHESWTISKICSSTYFTKRNRLLKCGSRNSNSAIVNLNSRKPSTHCSFQGMGFSMPLRRGQIVGHDNERLAFAFTMMNDGETVQCQISDAAMDELAEAKGTPSIERQAQLVAHRDTIDRIASDL